MLTIVAMALLLLRQHILRMSMMMKSNPPSTSRGTVQCLFSEKKQWNRPEMTDVSRRGVCERRWCVCVWCSSHHASWTPAWPKARRGTRTPPRNSSPNFRLLAFHRSTLNTNHSVHFNHGRGFTRHQVQHWYWHVVSNTAAGSPQCQLVNILFFNIKLPLGVT